MSKVKIQGNASGTGTLTISAPNTNTDRTLTLPDGAGEILTDASTLSSSNLSGALPAIDGSALTGVGGLTDASQWRLSTTHDISNGNVIGSNGTWEAFDDGNYGTLGSAMTESSGVFTFPSTGIWWIHFTSFCELVSTNGYIGAKISTTYNNGSNWDDAVENYHTNGSTGWYRPLSMNYIFDVASTSTHKVRFIGLENGGNMKFFGDTNSGQTYVTFFKLGET